MKTIEKPRAVSVIPDAAAPLETSTGRWDRLFHADLMADVVVEKRLLIKEAVILALVGLAILLAEVLR